MEEKWEMKVRKKERMNEKKKRKKKNSSFCFASFSELGMKKKKKR